VCTGTLSAAGPHPTSAANLPAAGAAVARWDRQTNGQTDTRPFYGVYRILRGPRNDRARLRVFYENHNEQLTTARDDVVKPTFCMLSSRYTLIPKQLAKQLERNQSLLTHAVHNQISVNRDSNYNQSNKSYYTVGQ